MDKLVGLHKLILQKRGGTPDELASILGISRSCFFRYLEKLKILGAEFTYCRTCNCYKYTNDFKLKITLETHEMTKILGGLENKLIYFSSVPKNETEGFYFS